MGGVNTMDDDEKTLSGLITDDRKEVRSMAKKKGGKCGK